MTGPCYIVGCASASPRMLVVVDGRAVYACETHRPCRRIPFLGEALTGAMLGVLAAALVLVCGCTSLTVPIRAANATRATAVELIAVVDAVCSEPAREALAANLSPEASAAEAERLEALGCPEAWRAQTAVSEAHGAMVALLTAIQAGQCQATVAAPAPARCDLARATMALVEAGARLVRATDALRAEVEQ